MFIYRKKALHFLSKPWFFCDKGYGDFFYISRLPQTDFLQILAPNRLSTRYPIATVSIGDFIMCHQTNKKRSEAAHFVFYLLEWWDNICIRTAYELDQINTDPEYAKSRIMDGNSLRIINGEVWTKTDYEVEKGITDKTQIVTGHNFDQYPELDYGILALPPFEDPRDRLVKPLKFMGWDSTIESILNQIRVGYFKPTTPEWHKLKGSEFVTRM